MNRKLLQGIFPCPVYIVKRDSNLTFDEKKEIENIFKEGIEKKYW